MRTIAVLLCVFTLSGCFSLKSRYAQYSVVSTADLKNVDMSSLERMPAVARGEDMAPIILFIPCGVPKPEKAVADALQKNNAVLLENAVISSEMFYIPLLYGEVRYIVEGDAWRRKP